MADPSPPQTNVTDAIAQESQNIADTLKVVRQRVEEIAPVLDNLKGILGKGAISAVERAEFQLIDMALEGRRALIREVEERARPTVQIAEMLERATGFNAQTLKDFQTGADTAIGALRENTYKTLNDLTKARVSFNDGTTADLAALHTNLADVVETYNKAYIDDARLYKFAAQAMNADFSAQAQLAVDNLKISTTDLNFIAQLELSKTGKISKDSLLEFEKTVAATVQLSGIAPTKVAEDLLAIQRNFQTFGDISKESAGSLIKTMGDLGLAVDDVTRLAANFQSFDRAAQSMSNLAASTGVTLDTLELFQLANTDQEAFIISLREQLESQGLEFERMNVLQQKQVAQALGIDPRTLQRLLSDNLSALGDTRYELQSKIAGLSEEDTEKFINSMQSVKDASQGTSEAIAAAKSAALEASVGLAAEIERSYKSMLTSISDATKMVGGQRGAQQELLRQLVEVLKEINNMSMPKPEIKSGEKATPSESGGQPSVPPPPAPNPPATSGPPPIEVQDTLEPIGPLREPTSINASTGDYVVASRTLQGGLEQFQNAISGFKSTEAPPVVQPIAPTAAPEDYLISALSGGFSKISDAVTSTRSPVFPAPNTEAPPVQKFEHVITLKVTGDGSDYGELVAKMVAPYLAQVGVVIDGNEAKFLTNNRAIT